VGVEKGAGVEKGVGVEKGADVEKGVGVEKGVEMGAGVQEIEIHLGLPTVKVFSSDVFFFPRLICYRF
jgi:hypothetical protein